MKDILFFQQLFETYMAGQNLVKTPVGLYEPVRYIMDLGGKRIRPVLTLMGCHIYEDHPGKALPAAMAMELFHNFSLMHDDIMDQASLRRGQPAVHTRYGLNTGILSGDAMLIMSYQYLLNTESETNRVSRAVRAFTHAAAEVCEGQQMDMDFETRADVTLKEYLKMIEGKTAALLGGCLEVGAWIGGAADVGNLAGFGRNIGIAFQIQDDLLDTFGDPRKVGKKPGGDILQNKKTALFLLALELGDDLDRQELLRLYSGLNTDPDAKIKAVTRIFQKLDIPGQVRVLQEQYQESAFRQLEQLEAPAERKAPLRLLANQLLERDL